MVKSTFIFRPRHPAAERSVRGLMPCSLPAAQSEQQHGRDARLRHADARGDALVVVITEHPVRPAAFRQRALVLIDQGGDAARIPHRLQKLKVERQTPVTRERAAKYMAQVVQYAVSDGSRLSILAILDMSRKELPIGTPENYMFPLYPAQHGIDNPSAPSTVYTLIVNGNLPVPSAWSRRKGGRERVSNGEAGVE